MSADESTTVGRYTLNADGPFYIIDGTCICCRMPEHEAPELMAFDEENSHCYFKRQPQTDEEVEHAVSAMLHSCIEGLRYAGNDPRILEMLREGKSLCDIYGVEPSTWQRRPEQSDTSFREAEKKSLLRKVLALFKDEE